MRARRTWSKEDDKIAWSMTVVACYLAAWVVWAGWLRHSWIGIAGTYVLTGGILWCIVRLNRAAKCRGADRQEKP